jgi:4-hydroxy-tetrahydrodipicolinate synthase
MSTETTTFSGIVPPIVTPLTLEGEVDTTSLERLLSLQIEAGVDGLFVLGSSGEVGYLTDAQRAQVVQTAIGHVGGQVPVLVGVNDMTTNRVIAVAEQAREAGADAIVATAPFYAITDAAETATHFRSIHAAVDLPLFAYDVPVRVHSKLSPAMLVELGREGVIAGVKDSSGDDVSFRMLLRQSAGLENFAVFTGHEVVVDGCLLMGASGAVPGLANVDPHARCAGRRLGGGEGRAGSTHRSVLHRRGTDTGSRQCRCRGSGRIQDGSGPARRHHRQHDVRPDALARRVRDRNDQGRSGTGGAPLT